MLHINLRYPSIFLLTGLLVSSFSLSTLAQLESTQQANSSTSYTDRGHPTQGTTGTASRGSCDSGVLPEQLVAYIPSTTTEGYPDFEFEIPYQIGDFHSIEFSLNRDDAEETVVYETQLTETEALPGMIQVSLPSTMTELEVNANYNWKLVVFCEDPHQNPLDQPKAILVKGDIQRVEATGDSEESELSQPTSSNLDQNGIKIGNSQ